MKTRATPHHSIGSSGELARFVDLQRRLGPLFQRILPDPRAPRTVVVVPSLSLDPDVLAKLKGIQHYEERLLCMLMLLRLPRTRMVYVTSQPIHPWIVDYYLQLLPGVPSSHALKRLTLLSAFDGSKEHSLSQKILRRPRLLERLRRAIGDPRGAHLSVFNVTGVERNLAVQLGIPIYGCDPMLLKIGGKSGSRRVFREAGVRTPEGAEGLHDESDIVAALVELKGRMPGLRRAVIKQERGTSGLGNAIFDFQGAPEGGGLLAWIRRGLHERLEFNARDETWERFCTKFERKGGVVECWIEGQGKLSPSVQGRVDALGRVELISTHEQVLGGPCGQTFLGSLFPADEAYRLEIQELGLRVGRVLQRHGVVGRFGVDFVSVRSDEGWQHFAIENNIRKGGTTHTYRTLQFLTDGVYDVDEGVFRTPAGQQRCYWASDNIENPTFRRLTPEDLVDIAVENRLHFDVAVQQGVVFHLVGALSQYGKLGMVCVAPTREAACELSRQTVAVLEREAAWEGR